MTKMICLECGHIFNSEENKFCPICKNTEDKTLLKSLDFKDYKMHGLGICKDEEIKYEVKNFLDSKTHSAAYIKLCAKELERMGYMHLSVALEKIAHRKVAYESMLMEVFGVKDDIRLNLNNVLMKAEEDVKFASKIAKLAKQKDDDAVHDLMHEMARSEAENLTAIMGILDRFLIESQPKP